MRWYVPREKRRYGAENGFRIDAMMIIVCIMHSHINDLAHQCIDFSTLNDINSINSLSCIQATAVPPNLSEK